MKKTFLLGVSLLSSLMTHAGLQVLDSQAMAEVRGQAGADLSLNLQLNQTGMNGDFDTALCTDLRFCRLGLSLNKRYLKETTTGSGVWRADDISGNKLWLVFKGIQGTVNIQKLGLDGVDLVYNNDAGQVQIKPAIQLSYSSNYPILIRNFGYQSLAIEKDSVADEGANNIPGYLVSTAAGVGSYTYTGNTFDGKHPTNAGLGRETGFTGLMMNGNLAIQGNVVMFACDGSHPRC
ncbi:MULTISPECIES: DUF6160 family protein [Acinetobacter]|uniref:DUF6160 family protein n=3 Tax=Moraxellaceae TaxID=468 RepID=UPI00051C8078|nr:MULTISPECIES: DUF6160 family protein [Acinetobacter]MCH7379407.1 hypothetical protein [Acinetobacter higginsii]MCJ0829037.1 hypothetical protein [Acinetobacter sp. NIPH1876]MDO3664955.1 hypothetical protein [Acinetobacter higginsii]